MKNINFNVSQDTIEKLSEDVVISDSYNYVCLIFNFDSSWSQYNVKKATFFSDYEDGEEKYEADIVNNVCVVPFEILKKSKFKDSFFIGVYGQVIEDEILKQRNTTNMINFKLRQGAYFANALNPGEIEPSAYDLYLAKLNEVFEKGLNEYNKNADEKIKEINNKVSDVEKIEENIEQIQKNVQASEQNAKDSEISAQNSAKKSSESESNIISIEKNINDLKKDIDNTKTQIDEKAKEVKNNSDIAIEQAKVATEQATLSGQNANKTSADKEDISQMKVSIEASEDNIEEIEKNVQAIKDDIEADKNETLEAKEEVENSLENERIISDKRYARALKTKVEDVEQTQIYAENDVVDDLVIRGAELTQTVTEQSENIILLEDYPTTNNNGIDVTIKDNKITLNGTATADINLQLPIKYKSKGIITGDMCLGYITSGDLSNGNGNITLYSTTSGKNIGLYFPKVTNSPLLNYAHRNVEDFQINYINLYIAKNGVADNIVIDFTLANVASLDAGISFTPNSPSLDFPSEVQVANEQNIQICQMNLFNGIIYGNTPILRVITTDFIMFDSTKDLKVIGLPDKSVLEGNGYKTLQLYTDKNTKIKSISTANDNIIINSSEIPEGVKYLNIVSLSRFKTYEEMNNYISSNKLFVHQSTNEEEYQNYNGVNITIPLTNTAIGEYFDVIDRENKKQDKVIQELILTGNENYNFNNVENGIYQYSIIPVKKPIYINDSIIRAMSNYFKGVGRDGSWNIDNSITTNMSNIRFMTSQYTTVEDFKVKIKELYQAGTPVKIYYVAETSTPEPLSEEVKQELDKFKLYDGLNNISIDNGTLSFKYNKSLLKVLEEKDEKIDDLQSQIDEIKALLSSSSTASLLLENLANDNESEVS